MPPKYFTPKPEAVHVYLSGREVCQENAAGKREYYTRIRVMAERQDQKCAICGRFMVNPTFEHQDGKGMGGSHQDDRIEIGGEWYNAAACYTCNGAKGSRRFHWVNGVYKQVEGGDDMVLLASLDMLGEVGNSPEQR